MTNTLYYGDNLDVLRQHVKDESVDLIYLDPPFNSNATYNVLFAERNGSQAAAQIKAFEDTWQWDESAAAAFAATVEAGGRVAEALQAFRLLLGTSNMLAYLTMMAPRLVELRRVLKRSGSIYLHCDPTASHYLKVLMDAVFGVENYRNEIVWKRTSAHSDTRQGMRRFGRLRDVLLFYGKTDNITWNSQYTPYTPEYLEAEYRHIGTDGRAYKETDLTAAKPGGDTEYAWRVKRPMSFGARWEADLDEEYANPRPGWQYLEVRPYKGRYWAYSKRNLSQFAREGRIVHRSTGMPRLLQLMDDMPGVPLQDIWSDIPPALGGQDLGYPTQKPEALLERIIRASSNEGDTVLDPFCGCGTSIVAAQKLGRRWLGIDVTHLAIGLIKRRLHDTFGDQAQYSVVGEPTTEHDAAELARSDPYQFQFWALGLVGARTADQKKGGDKGIDGRLYFHDEGASGKTKQVVISVKGGRLKPEFVRDLYGVLEREQAAIGVLITLEEPSKGMRAEAAGAGVYHSTWGEQDYPRLQLLTVGELLAGQSIAMPPLGQVNVTFKKAGKAKPTAVQLELGGGS